MDEERIPQEWRSRAFVARNGELAWRRNDALGVLPCLVALDLALLGGEIWAVTVTGEIWGALPRESDGVAGVYHWETVPDWDPSTENWLEFCLRGAAHSAEAIRNLPDDAEVRSDLRSLIHYNLTFVTRDSYARLKEQR